MTRLKTLIEKTKTVLNTTAAVLVGTLAVIASFVTLSFFATIGLAVLGISAVFLSIPLLLNGLATRQAQQATPA